MKNSSIVIYRSPQPKTAFAPFWEYATFEADVFEELQVKRTAKVILDNEKKIIQQYEYIHDWNTGLGPDSVTSRANWYNLLDFEELQYLRGIIRYAHDKFLEDIHVPYEKSIYVQCWCNVLRKGQQIKLHHHSTSPYTYLGGHIVVQTTNTNTNYVNPYTKEIYNSINVPGKITLFPNWVEHFTDTYQDEGERITIAFDICNELTFTEDIFEEKKSHWVRL
jgi:hypothetical protein